MTCHRSSGPSTSLPILNGAHVLDIREQKRALRAEMRKLRRETSMSLPDASLRLRDVFLSSIPLPEKSIISAYIAMDDEIDPLPLVNAFIERGHIVCLPTIVAPCSPLKFRVFDPSRPLVKVAHSNAPEPDASCPEITPSIILLPLLAFDNRGYRLGYGGGYYDRTLATLGKNQALSRAIGLAFSSQQVPRIPNSKYDRKLNGVVTETGATTKFGE